MPELSNPSTLVNHLNLVTRDDEAIRVGSFFTAVPVGRAWRVKAISPNGESALLGSFDGRLTALGAAVLLAAQADGRVLP